MSPKFRVVQNKSDQGSPHCFAFCYTHDTREISDFQLNYKRWLKVGEDLMEICIAFNLFWGIKKCWNGTDTVQGYSFLLTWGISVKFGDRPILLEISSAIHVAYKLSF